jgi:uncharacterized protein (DUF427 family)
MERRGRVKVESGHKRIRGYIGGELVFDTTKPMLVWEVPYYPAYYVPSTDVLAELTPNGETASSPSRGTAECLDVRIAGVERVSNAWRYPDSPLEQLRDLVRFEWGAIDEWLEEDEPVYTHPRDPYTRVDILRSSRQVQVVVEGVKIADSSRPTILFETGLPPRYYLPLSDIRMDLLQPSETHTYCPYKGEASYWSLALDGSTRQDFVWTYRSPLAESQKVAGLACFYNEKVDLYLDGELQDRPKTKFS